MSTLHMMHPLPTQWNNLWLLRWTHGHFSVIFPMISIPHIENGHGDVKTCNSEGSAWIRSPCIWHSGHFWTKWQQSVSIVNQKYPNLIILRVNMCPPICGPQTHAWTSLITRSAETRSKHKRSIPSADRLYKVFPHITNLVANYLNALWSLAVATLGYGPDLRNWWMSWNHGRSS